MFILNCSKQIKDSCKKQGLVLNVTNALTIRRDFTSDFSSCYTLYYTTKNGHHLHHLGNFHNEPIMIKSSLFIFMENHDVPQHFLASPCKIE